MSQLPFTNFEYATVPPSGERVGGVSSPAASVIRAKDSQRPSGLGRALNNHATVAAAIASAATVHGSHHARERRIGAATPTGTEDTVDTVETVSRANARSFAD